MFSDSSSSSAHRHSLLSVSDSPLLTAHLISLSPVFIPYVFLHSTQSQLLQPTVHARLPEATINISHNQPPPLHINHYLSLCLRSCPSAAKAPPHVIILHGHKALLLPFNFKTEALSQVSSFFPPTVISNFTTLPRCSPNSLFLTKPSTEYTPQVESKDKFPWAQRHTSVTIPAPSPQGIAGESYK